MILSIMQVIAGFIGVLALLWLAEAVVTWYRNQGPFRVVSCKACEWEESIKTEDTHMYRGVKCCICHGPLSVSEELDI